MSLSYLKKLNYSGVVVLYSLNVFLLSFLIILGRVQDSFSLSIPANKNIVLFSMVVILLINILTFKDIISPPVLLSAIWVFPLYVSCLEFEFNARFFNFFNDKVSVEVILVFINAILAFSLGSLLLHRKILNFEKYKSLPITWNSKRGNIILWISFVLGIIAYSYAVLLKGTIPIFSEVVNETRDNFRPPFWGNFFAYLVFTVIIAIAKIAFEGRKKISSKFGLFLAFICTLAVVFSTARVDLVYIFIVSGILFFVVNRRTNRNFNLGKILFQFFIVATLFIMVFQQVAKVRGLNEGSIIFVDASPLTATYLAYGGPCAVKNFQRVLDEEINYPRTYGAFTMRPLLWYIGFRGLVDLENDFKGPNTASWLYEYYCDFGILGIILIPFLLGMASEKTYQNMIKGKDFIGTVVYGFVVVFILITINNDRFFGVSNTVFFLGFIPLYYLYKYKFKLK